MERAAIFSQGQTILVKHLSPEIINPSSGGHMIIANIMQSLEEVETAHIMRVLAHTRNNRPQAAKILGISQSTLWRKLQKLNIDEG